MSIVFVKITHESKAFVTEYPRYSKAMSKTPDIKPLFAIIECNVTKFINFQETPCIRDENAVKYLQMGGIMR